MPVTHSGFIGRACGPDSPPTITQSIPRKFNFPIGPISGSIERNLTCAPVLRRWLIRCEFPARLHEISLG